MSNIPLARKILEDLLVDPNTNPHTRRQIRRALTRMCREPYARQAPKQYRKIDAQMRRRIRQLDATDMTMQEIAVAVGLRSSGRVNEVLHGKR